jgi:hypothetical protein
MALILPENVQETTETTGTGAYTLLGAVSGALAFGSQLSNDDEVLYAVFDGTDIEVGMGTYSLVGGIFLFRDLILYSTNGGSAVNWSTGTRNVVAGLPGTWLAAALLDDTLGLFSGSFTVTGTGFVSDPSGTAKWQYNRQTGLVSLFLPRLTGTSDSDLFTLTGIPTALNPPSAPSDGVYWPAMTIEGTTKAWGTIGFVSFDQVWYVEPVPAVFGGLGNWPTSGVKELRPTFLNYHLQ